MKRIKFVGTYDTKGEELDYLAGLIAVHELPVLRVDVSTQHTAAPHADIPASEIASHWPAPHRDTSF